MPSSRVSAVVSQLADAPISDSPMRVVVTGAAGNIAYSILFGIGRGKLLGPNQKMELVLLDIEPMMKKLQGVVMEMNDCAFPLITKMIPTCDYQEAFTGADVCLLIGAFPRKKGMLRADLLQKNASIFKATGTAMNKYAKATCKTLVVGNPANTNALIASNFCPNIPKENFHAMTRLDQNRAMSQLASRLGCEVGKIKNVVIWGNHSKTQYPDVNQAFVSDMPQDGFAMPMRTAVNDNDWLDGEFIKTVQQRGAAIIQARGASSAASAANAALDHVRDWFLGTSPGQWVSMGVPSDGSYGVPKGIVFSFPCTCAAGEYKIVQGLKLNARSQKLIKATADELLQERKDAGLTS